MATTRERPTPADPVSRIMARTLATVRPEDGLLAVAQELTADEVGAVVVESPGSPPGVVSERDLVTVLALDGDLTDRQAADVMTTDLVTARESETIAAIGRLMCDTGVRHVLVVDEEAAGATVVGLVSMRDVLAVLLPDDEPPPR